MVLGPGLDWSNSNSVVWSTTSLLSVRFLFQNPLLTVKRLFVFLVETSSLDVLSSSSLEGRDWFDFNGQSGRRVIKKKVWSVIESLSFYLILNLRGFIEFVRNLFRIYTKYKDGCGRRTEWEERGSTTGTRKETRKRNREKREQLRQERDTRQDRRRTYQRSEVIDGREILRTWEIETGWTHGRNRRKRRVRETTGV